jgi:hypothetical protein
MKFVQTDYAGTKNILRFPDHYVAVPVTVDDTDIALNEDGKKIVPAGTIVGGVGGKVLDDPDAIKVAHKNDAGAEGVLLNDADVTYGPCGAAMIIHGFPATGTLPEAPSAEAVTALQGRIVFVK